MPVEMIVTNGKLFEITAMLPALIDGIADHAAETLYRTAVDTCPVDTGAMKDSHLKEKIGEGEYEVSVQKAAALSGEKTYGLFVNGGTVFQQAQPWFTDACQAGADALQASVLAIGGI